MKAAKAYLRCVKLRKDGTEMPEFALSYKKEVIHRFKADHMGEAGQIARHVLNQRFGHLKVSYEWREKPKKAVHFNPQNGALDTAPCGAPKGPRTAAEKFFSADPSKVTCAKCREIANASVTANN